MYIYIYFLYKQSLLKMSVSNIASNASSNISLYNSIQIKDYYYEKCVNPSILITSIVKEKLDYILGIDYAIEDKYEQLQTTEKDLKEFKTELSYKTQYQFIITTHRIKICRQLRREIIDRIHYLHNLKNECYQEMIQSTDDSLIQDSIVSNPYSFPLHITITESNKLRSILRMDNKKSYLMNMTSESRNKRKNSREMNKLLFGKIKSSNKHNKIRKTNSPNNNKYY